MSNETELDNIENDIEVEVEESTSTTDDVQPHVEETTTPDVDPYEEDLRMAKELNLTIRKDPQTGKPIIPSTPAMRAALKRKAAVRVDDTTTADIQKMVSDHYDPIVCDNPNIQHVIATLGNYVKRMSPNAAIDEVRGGEIQAELAGLYDLVLSLDPELSTIGLEIIVSVIKMNLRGAFSQTLAYRFANTIPLNKELSIRFQLLTTLFISLASGTKKKDLSKTINVRQLHDYITDRNAKANISEFIN